MENAIWTGLDIYTQLYECNELGIPTSTTPIISYCFFQNCSLYGGINWVQRAGFGNPRRNLESEDEWDLYTLRVGHFYFKDAELDTDKIFNRDAYLYIELWLCGDFAGMTGKDSEIHAIAPARAQNFSINLTDNQSAEGEANFISNQYLRPVAVPLFQTV